MKNLFILFAIIALSACKEPTSDFKIAEPTPINEKVINPNQDKIDISIKENPEVEPTKQTKPKATTPGALRKPLDEK